MQNTDKPIFNDVNQDLIYSIIRVTRSLDRAISKSFAGKGRLTPEQDAVLQMLNTHGKSTIAEISALLIREHNTISSLLDRMERSGLVIKHKDKLNSNKVTVELPPNILENWSPETVKNILDEVLSVLSEHEKEQMKTISKKISDKALEISQNSPKVT